MAAVAQEKGLGFGEAIGRELGIVDGCVEINQCVGCRIILHYVSAPSSGPASPRHRAGVTSMAWEVHAAIQDECAVNLISTQVDGKKIELPAILSDKPFKNMGGNCTPSAWRQCPDQAMQSPARRGNKETEDQLANKFTRRRAQLQIEKAGGSVDDVAPKATKPSPPPAEATSKVQGLPEPWVEVTDEKTGKVYYGNTKTGATQWARPE